MDIEFVVRQTIVGAVVVTGFLFLYNLVIAVFAGGLAASPGASVSTFLAVFLTAVIFTFLLQPAQQFLVGALDRIFFRNRYHQWEKMASLGVLAAGVAHELNTPLGVVLSSADQLVEDQDSGRAHPVRSKRLAQLCLGGAKRAADIVQNLRAFSRPESQDLQLVDVHDLIDGTLSLLGPRLESQGISVKQRRGAILPLEGYPVLLNQTLTNLILNAANAAGDNGEIRITTEFRDHDTVAVIVEDDGPGIPEELSGRIYEPFFTTRPPGEGSGLGLSLCYTIVDQHGGKIWEEGEPGEGARFVVELPLRASDQLRRRSLSGEPSR
jgi:signal transduction histidine kinase